VGAWGCLPGCQGSSIARMCAAAQFKLDEAVLAVGAAYHTALAAEYLAAQAAGAAREEL